ncbi:PfkB family carbohydrate kinase [Paramicrobacterium agarici]|uniref:PfkB family carbohydrate kinase n=1 Tax=Paramicrobacterium agarici TaxID=630514 RepID=UPI0011516C2E|nr:PfkB family carbohydrate kinase [Microbacterium agarici]TQO22946.1 fructoselysine 6-kinase [Microbacterium agarici]
MRLLGVGDNVVDRYVNLGREYPGGNAVNVAVFARRLGAESSYMGVLGDDLSGQYVLDSLRREGVGTEHCEVAQGPNAFAEVEIVDHDRVFVGAEPNVAKFTPEDSHFEQMSGFDVVHCGYAGTFGPSVARIAARSRVSYDFGSEGKFVLQSDELLSMLPHLYLASFSGSHLDAAGVESLAQYAIEKGAKYALVTRGGEGAYLAQTTQGLWQDAELINVVDTLGAGDAFIASVLVGLLSQRKLSDVLASASAHAAHVCMRYGAFGDGRPFSSKDMRRAKKTDSLNTKAGIQ